MQINRGRKFLKTNSRIKNRLYFPRATFLRQIPPNENVTTIGQMDSYALL